MIILAPGELQDVEIVARALLLNTTEMTPKIAESRKKTKPTARIAIAIFIEDFFNIHGVFLISEMIRISFKPFTCRLLPPFSNSVTIVCPPHCCHCEERSDAAISVCQTDTNYEIASPRPQRWLTNSSLLLMHIVCPVMGIAAGEWKLAEELTAKAGIYIGWR